MKSQTRDFQRGHNLKQIFFVRHGQASFGKESYDNLSDLGILQSKKLNEYFKKEGLIFDLCITGNLLRHRQTKDHSIEGMLTETVEIIETDFLNEFPESLWKKIAHDISLEDKNFAILLTRVMQQDKKTRLFFKIAERIILEWVGGRTPVGEESYKSFRERTLRFPGLLTEKIRRAKLGIVFSSGTPISILLSHYAGIPEDRELNWLTYIWNTSLSVLQIRNDKAFFSQINSIPHLSKKERSLI